MDIWMSFYNIEIYRNEEEIDGCYTRDKKLDEEERERRGRRGEREIVRNVGQRVGGINKFSSLPFASRWRRGVRPIQSLLISLPPATCFPPSSSSSHFKERAD